MNVPIRGIQLILVAAFVLELTGVILEWRAIPFESLRAGAETQSSIMQGAIGRLLKDLAYTTYYLGSVAMIELLHRIWRKLCAER